MAVAEGHFAILRLDPGTDVPSWALGGDGFSAVVRTGAELSLLVPEEQVPVDFPGDVEAGWRGLFVCGKLEFGLVGVLAGLTAALAEEGIGILAVSTFETDWLFVKAGELQRACAALASRGYRIALRPSHP